MSKQAIDAIFTAFAGPDKDFTYPTMMGIYRQTDPTLKNKGADVRLYHNILLDPHAYSCLRKRATAQNAYEWDVKAASEKSRDKRAAAIVKEQLANMRFQQIREEMLIAELVYGFQVGECMWRRDGEQIVLDDILSRDQVRFAMDDKYRIRLKTMSNMLVGDLVPDRKFIWTTFDRRMNGPYGRGLGAVLWWPVHFKRMLQGFWLDYADRFTTPSVVGTAPDSSGEAEMKTVLAAAENVTDRKAAALPPGAKLEMLESKRAAAEAVFHKFIQYLDEEISKAVLGEAVTSSGSSNASKAAAQTGTELKKENAISDANRLDTALNKGPVTWITEFNVPGATPPKVVTNTKDPVDLKKQAETDATVASMGVARPSIAYIKATYGDGWEEIPPAERIGAKDPASSPAVAGGKQVNINAAAEV